MAGDSRFLISFPDKDVATANNLGNDLADSLAEDVPRAEVARLREDPLSQDFGATLVVILGTSAVTALAKGVATWLSRRQDAHLLLRRVDQDGQMRELTVNGQPSARTERLMASFFAE